MNRPMIKKHILQGALMACLLYSGGAVSGQETITEQVIGTQHQTVNEAAPIEFETFITRYSTHHPQANFEKTATLAQNSLISLCDKHNLPSDECALSKQELGIEALLSDVYSVKNLVSKKSQIDLSQVDEWLLQKGISNTGDPYTQMATTHSTSTPSGTTQVDKDTLKIQHFDTAKGCVSKDLLDRIDEFEVIDLKDNRGGDLSCTINALESLLPVGKHHVATIYTTTGERGIWAEGKADESIKEGKSVLVNENTASSAEIFAHSLSENGWDVKGFPMMGKRSIQARFSSSYGDYFMTIGNFEIPSVDK